MEVKYPLELLHLMLICKNYASEVYLVGGCVRDQLLGKQPKDFDIVINGNLDLIIKELKTNGWKIDEAGLNFLVLIASYNNKQFEIAVYRKDGTYTDGRRPENVNIGTIEDDALRRDFPINSLYYNPFNKELRDPTGNGLSDLKNKIIRFNGKPKERIKEDLLRIMRCYRFASSLGFTIEQKTLKNCRRYFSEMCEKIPPERIRLEVEKMSNV